MKILFATDGSEATARAASFLAPLVGAGTDQVRVLIVLPYVMHPHGERGSPERARMEAAAAAQVEEISNDVVRALGDMGDRLTIRRRFGHPPDEIALAVAEWEPDLVVLGRRGLRGPARWLGSVSERVLHQAKVPVLLVR